MSKENKGKSERNRSKSALVVFGLFAAGMILFSYGFAVGKYQIPPYSALQKVKTALVRILDPEPPVVDVESANHEDINPVNDILSLMREQEFSSATEEIDFIRAFINTNSIHLGDEEFWEYSYDTNIVLGMMYETYLNDAPPPHMLCDTRTYAMKALVKELGYIAREVHVFSDDFDTLQSHTFLEVYNEKTKMWEIQDPDFNICYVDEGTSNRLSVTHLVMGNLDHITPCSASPEQTELVKTVLMDHYYEAAVILGAPEQSFILINTARFSLVESKKYFSSEDGVDNFIDYLK